jgi:hypothetical protein
MFPLGAAAAPCRTYAALRLGMNRHALHGVHRSASPRNCLSIYFPDPAEIESNMYVTGIREKNQQGNAGNQKCISSSLFREQRREQMEAVGVIGKRYYSEFRAGRHYFGA